MYHRRGAETALYDAGMTAALWLCFAFLVVATVGSMSYAFVHGRRMFKAMRAVSGPIEAAVAHIEVGSAVAEDKVAAFEGGNARLTAAVERLQRSLAEFAVLQQAAGEARSAFRRVSRSVPRK